MMHSLKIINVQSRFQEHKGELQHLPSSSQSPVMSITEQLWSVLVTRMRNKFPLPTSLRQLEDVLQEEWYKIPLQTVQNLCECIPRRTASVLKAQDGPAPH
jgi:hypothetical protein